VRSMPRIVDGVEDVTDALEERIEDARARAGR
jgi:hypothetical protein